MPLAATRHHRAVHRDVVHVLLLAVVDAFAMFEAFDLAYALRASDPAAFAHPTTLGAFAAMVALISPLWVVLFAFAGLYQIQRRRPWPATLGRIGVAVSGGMMALIAVDYMRQTSSIFPARSVPIYAVVFGTALVALGRAVVKIALTAAYSRNRGLHRVVLLGAGPTARRIARDLQLRSRGYDIVGFVEPELDGATLLGNVPVYRTLEQAMAAAAAPIDEIVQTDDTLGREKVAQLAAEATAAGITYRFVPDQYGVYAAASSMTTIDGVPVMQVSLTSLDGWGAIGKRAFDLVGSTLLLILLSPLLAVLAALVKLTDPQGPVFYRQERVGRGGVPIRVTKFRTMGWKYSTGPGREFETAEGAFRAMGREDLLEEFARDHKVTDDPRVTALGRFLRKTSLDELPQLIQSLRGHLSLVGPRPITSAELERYGAQQRSFLALKPGITGLWQVSGRSDVSYDERVKLDIYYIENWSARMDLSILARTTTAVLMKRGAC